MDANRKKELRAEYKDRRADAGVVSIRCIETNEIYLAVATDIPATFNKMEFQITLAARRIEALEVAESLIEKELNSLSS